MITKRFRRLDTKKMNDVYDSLLEINMAYRGMNKMCKASAIMFVANLINDDILGVRDE